MKKITLFFLLLCSISAIAQKTHYIEDPEDLSDLSATLAAGDTVILLDGEYDSDERIKFSPSTGTSDLPITFRPETPGGVVFTGGLKMSIGGDYVVVDGFYWKGGYGASNFIEFRDGYNYANHSIIQNCAINGLAIDPDDVEAGSITKHRWIVLYGTYNTVINCSFMDKKSAGALVLVELEYNASSGDEDDEDRANTRCDIVGHTISNNYFYKYEKIDASLSNAGDSETIRVGTSEYQNVNSSTTVTNNYFVEADGENEIITNKSKNNVYTNNTFRRSRGSLVLRHGSNAYVEGNYFLGENVEGTGGIRIVDSEHIIKNNYIQDCINVDVQAKWNNGITFLGGGDSADVDCNSTSVSNGYQKSQNITLDNNTIVNTNAPLFYNIDKGKNKVTGDVSNNLIYYVAGNSNVTDVITGDTDDSYSDIGTTLDYTGNVYTGTALGVTNAGFSEASGITATADGEIFTFSGADGKGADMGTYSPTTDDMVGYGIGACFLNFEGAKITGGDCTIKIGETLTVSSLPTLDPIAGSYDVTVNANVDWTAVSNDSWISIDTDSGSGDQTVSVTVTENTETGSRTGTVTFTQVAGGDDIVRDLVVTQEGAPRTNLINTGESDDPVKIESFSSENGGKGENAANTLNKNKESIWAAEDGAVLAGDYKGDGEYIIYDLGSEYALDFIQFSTTDKSDPFGIQIWVSTTGTADADFSMILPTTTGDLLLTQTGTTDFNEYEVNNEKARYVKLIGYGRFNAEGTKRESAWSAIGVIDFYGSSTLSTDHITATQVKLFPNPVSNGVLYLSKQSNSFDELRIYDVSGKTILTKKLNASLNKEEINVSSLSQGLYFVEVRTGNKSTVNKIVISK